VDATQFAAAPLLPTDIFAATITGAPALTVVARDEGNRLKMQVVGLAQQGPLIWPVAASLGLVLPMRYIFRFSMFATVNISTNVYTGVCYYTDGEVALGSSHGITFLSNSQSVAGYQGVNTDGTYDTTGGTPACSGQPNVINLEVNGRKVVGVQPGGVINGRSIGLNGVQSILYFLTNILFTQPFPASWNALTEANLSQFGLAMHMNSIGEDDPFVEYGMLQILPHPLDW
jgi:hypothetical protein